MTASPPPSAVDDAELTRLRQIDREYRVTIIVVAVLAERLLSVTGGDAIEISDSALHEAPDLRAWRDPERKSVMITVESDHAAGSPDRV